MRDERIKKMGIISILATVIIVLQCLASIFKIGPFSITLVLIPMVVGTVLIGVKAGAILGFVFGLVVLIQCIFGFDIGGNVLWTANPFLTIIVCLGKGILAGVFAGLIYKALNKVNRNFAIIMGAIIAPVTNSFLFAIAMMTMFYEVLVSWAGGSNVVYYIIFGMIGINFLIELVINAVLSPVIIRICDIAKKEEE